MSESKRINIATPVSDAVIRGLSVGDSLLISGALYTARDAAHERLVQMIAGWQELPFDFAGQIVYYAGPAPARPGKPVGSIGPTTSGRMDAYSPILIERGLKIMIGKGKRDAAVRAAIVKHCGLYLTAVGGAAALAARCVISATPIAFDDLGPEAIIRLDVRDFPAIVAIDCTGKMLATYEI